MSWSVTINVNPNESIDDAIKAAFDQNPEARKQGGPQIEMAIEAAYLLIQGVSRPQDGVVIRLSGHYNPNLAPTPGWADCMISVSVSQIAAKELVSAS